MNSHELAAHIDQTLLDPTIGFARAAEWIEDNAHRGFASLCVSPFLTPLAAELLAGTGTKVCSVVAFPLGYANTESKVEEAVHLVELGCVEVDMVMNAAAFLEGEHRFVHDDIAAVVLGVTRASGERAIVKVILETGRLRGDDDVTAACHLAVEAGAAFVKTSTGFGPRGASLEDVRAMRAAVGPDIGVKASGGIRNLPDTLAMIEAGATRIGTSSGLVILEAFAGGTTAVV